jgi:hypothetical protein
LNKRVGWGSEATFSPECTRKQNARTIKSWGSMHTSEEGAHIRIWADDLATKNTLTFTAKPWFWTAYITIQAFHSSWKYANPSL